MPLIKRKELGGMIVGKKAKQPRSPSYVRLSSKEGNYNNHHDEHHGQPGTRGSPAIVGRKKESTPPRPPNYVKLSSIKDGKGDDERQGGTPKGHVPVMVGMEEDKLKRYMVPTLYMKDPSIVLLLQLSADEFGYYHQGILQIPCEPEYFEKIMAKLSNKR